MNPWRNFLMPLAAAILLTPPAWAANQPDPGQTSIAVAQLLERAHYSRKKLDDAMSQKLLGNYLENLDFTRLFFTQKDIDTFTAKYGTRLDDDILLGNPQAAHEIFAVYKERVEARMAKVKEWIKEEYDFKSDRVVQVNRQKADWPKDAAEAEQLWRDRVEGELLQERLNPHAIDPPAVTVNRRYDQMLRNVREQNREDVLKTFLSALAQTYDPHSEYLSKSDLENFSINMRLSLVGIGAVLQSDDGYAKIMDVVAGGPAQLDGRLKVNDRISAVAQGSKEFVDVVGMKLDKVVEMIRGKKGTRVRLQVVPAGATDPSNRKVVEIVRDEVKLKEQQAKADLIESHDSEGQPMRLGWITLPSFYADMERAGEKDAKSTTADVERLIRRLRKEGIAGLVIDLRRNGGGSLEEAVNLTGLFIKKGPVVQAKDSNGNLHVSRDRNTTVAWAGPLVVLTNRLSASASEIFAGALQDYGRAVVVGDDHTFGKGTVQTMIELGRFIPFISDSRDAGALKLTIQKFYRIAGGSTQLRGISSDIVLPSLYALPEIGETSMKAPLEYSELAPLAFEKDRERPLFLDELRQRSEQRVRTDRDFQYLTEDLELIKRKRAENAVSLNEELRRQELAAEKERKEKRKAERAARQEPEPKVFEITIETADKGELQVARNDGKNDPRKKRAPVEADGAAEEEEEEDAPGVDAVRIEALRILADLAELSRPQKTAAVK